MERRTTKILIWLFFGVLGSAKLVMAQNTGSGEQNSDIEIPRLLELRLEQATGTYAPYEEMELQRDNQNRIIPYSVFEPDDREPVVDVKSFPNSAIVQLLFEKPTGGQAICSGAMIAPDTVLTAAHCIHTGTLEGGWTKNIAVLPGRLRNTLPFGHCMAKETFIPQEWMMAKTVKHTKPFDFGVIKLDCTVGERTGWFDLEVIGDKILGKQTRVIGYAGDKFPQGVMWSSSDHMRAFENDIGFYQNDTFGGTSGSPVISDNENKIFCIHTSGRHNGGLWAENNACSRITPARLAQIEAWMTPQTTREGD